MSHTGEEDWIKVSGHEHRWKKITVGDLCEGKSYLFRVSAINSAGRGLPGVLPSAVCVGITLGNLWFVRRKIALLSLILSTELPQAKFVAPVKKNSLVVRAGETVRINTLITGRPTPEIMWTKDGKTILKTSASVMFSN